MDRIQGSLRPLAFRQGRCKQRAAVAPAPGQVNRVAGSQPGGFDARNDVGSGAGSSPCILGLFVRQRRRIEVGDFTAAKPEGFKSDLGSFVLETDWYARPGIGMVKATDPPGFIGLDLKSFK